VLGKHAGEVAARELGVLVGVDDLGCRLTECVDEGVHAEDGVHAIGQTPTDNVPAETVHHSHHTPQPEILDLELLICLETSVCKGGWLTALDVESGTICQINEPDEARQKFDFWRLINDGAKMCGRRNKERSMTVTDLPILMR